MVNGTAHILRWPDSDCTSTFFCTRAGRAVPLDWHIFIDLLPLRCLPINFHLLTIHFPACGSDFAGFLDDRRNRLRLAYYVFSCKVTLGGGRSESSSRCQVSTAGKIKFGRETTPRGRHAVRATANCLGLVDTTTDARGCREFSTGPACELEYTHPLLPKTSSGTTMAPHEVRSQERAPGLESICVACRRSLRGHSHERCRHICDARNRYPCWLATCIGHINASGHIFKATRNPDHQTELIAKPTHIIRTRPRWTSCAS